MAASPTSTTTERQNPSYIDGEVRLTRLFRSHAGRSASTSSASTSRSSTRNGLRPAATATNTSGSAASVHAVGTEVSVPSSKKKNTRSCCHVRRTPTNSKLRPTHGWNGCVTRTDRTEPSGSRVVEGVLQLRRGELLRNPAARAPRPASLDQPPPARHGHLRV